MTTKVIHKELNIIIMMMESSALKLSLVTNVVETSDVAKLVTVTDE